MLVYVTPMQANFCVTMSKAPFFDTTHICMRILVIHICTVRVSSRNLVCRVCVCVCVCVGGGGGGGGSSVKKLWP